MNNSTSKSTKSTINKLNLDQKSIDEVRSLLNTSTPQKEPLFNTQQLKEDLKKDNELKIQQKLVDSKIDEQLDLLTKIGL